jgi:hypothetical protein
MLGRLCAHSLRVLDAVCEQEQNPKMLMSAAFGLEPDARSEEADILQRAMVDAAFYSHNRLLPAVRRSSNRRIKQ